MRATQTMNYLEAISLPAAVQTRKKISLPEVTLSVFFYGTLLIGLWGAAALISGMFFAGGPLGLVDGFIHALSGV